MAKAGSKIDKNKVEAKTDRVYTALRIYAEKGAAFPDQKTLAQLVGLASGQALKAYIRRLERHERLKYIRDNGHVFVRFPDGLETTPRDVCVLRAAKRAARAASKQPTSDGENVNG